METRLLLAAGIDRFSDGLEIAPGELLIGFDQQAISQAQITLQLSRYASGNLATDQWYWQGRGTTQLHYELSGEVDVDTIATALAEIEGVTFAEPNFIVRGTDVRVPNDPRYPEIWGFDNSSGPGDPDADVDGPQAWFLANGRPGNIETVVGVIDSGIDYDHEDLYQNIWLNQGEIPSTLSTTLVDTDGNGIITFVDLNHSANWSPNDPDSPVMDLNANGYIDGGDLLSDPAWANGFDTDGNGYVDDLIGWDFAYDDNDPYDDHGHGTHVSGTIGAIGDNGIGVTGVNWDVQIMPLKFLTADNSGFISDADDAIRYAVAMGADVTNNSWGGGGFSFATYDAIASARANNQLFVAAAGNDSADNDAIPSYPASYDLDNIISVAASTRFDDYALFSNTGATSVDIAAPGVTMLSTTPGRYGAGSGTSMASPYVAGAAALVIGEYEKTNSGTLTYAQVRDLLYDSVDPMPGNRTTTNGRLNLFQALSALTPSPGIQVTPTSGLVVDETGTSASFSIVLQTAPASDVTIELVSSDLTEVAVSPTTLIFTSSNWNQPQSVTLTGIADGQIDPDQLVTIVTNPAISNDPIYAGLDADDVTVTNVNIDAAPLQIEHGTISLAAGSGWNTVRFNNTYVSPVIVTTPNYHGAGQSNIPAVARISNVTSTSFDIQLTNPGQTSESASVAGTVHYVVMESGQYNVDGVSLEAQTFVTSTIDRSGAWNGNPRGYLNSYAAPVVLAQVMSFNDANWSTAWTSGASRTAPPSSTALNVGLHVAQDPLTNRAAETIGYIVIESGAGSILGIDYEAGVGTDIVQGISNAPPYSYPVSAVANPQTVVATQAAMDGGDGGWAMLYGDQPVTDSQLQLAIDEDQLGDQERSHTTEQVAYLVLGGTPGPNLPSLSIGAPAAISEGNLGQITPVTFDITLSAPSDQPVTVNYQTDDQTATAGEDYAATTGSVTFAPGETLKSLSVNVLGDAIDEADETFRVLLSGAVGATLATGSATGVILDDDPVPTVSLAATPTVISETGGATEIAAHLSHPSAFPVTVDLGFAGTAALGIDYTPAASQIVVPAGALQSAMTVFAQSDTMDEPDETIVINTLSVDNAILSGPSSSVVTISDDDPLAQLSITGASVTEGDSGFVFATLNVTSSPVSGKDITVAFQTQDITATVTDGDYQPSTGTITIPAGSSTATVNVTIVGDTADEPDETFAVTLSDPINATLENPTATVTIVNDDRPTLSVSDITANENDSVAIMQIAIDTDPASDVTVSYATADGTALAGDDYQSTGGQVTFVPGGLNQQSILIPIVDDAVFEPSEQFSVVLSGVTGNALIGKGTGVVTIQDDDAPPASHTKLFVTTSTSGTDWQRIDLPYSYESMVVIGTPNYHASSTPAVVRVRNAEGSSFEFKVQGTDGSNVAGVGVHLMAIEEGVYPNLGGNGLHVEAVRMTQTPTFIFEPPDGKNQWSAMPRSYQNAYTNPVVVGQVITDNPNTDNLWASFWARGASRIQPPDATTLRVNRHVGEDFWTVRTAETIGYLVVESGRYDVDGHTFIAEVGGDTVRGIQNGPPFTYGLPTPLPAADQYVVVASSAGMDGNDGGWPVLYGDQPVSPTSVQFAIDEDQHYDWERRHTTEQIAYLAFAAPSTTIPLTATQTDISTSSSDVREPSGTGMLRVVPISGQDQSPEDKSDKVDVDRIVQRHSSEKITDASYAPDDMIRNVDQWFDELGRFEDDHDSDPLSEFAPSNVLVELDDV